MSVPFVAPEGDPMHFNIVAVRQEATWDQGAGFWFQSDQPISEDIRAKYNAIGLGAWLNKLPEGRDNEVSKRLDYFRENPVLTPPDLRAASPTEIFISFADLKRIDPASPLYGCDGEGRSLNRFGRSDIIPGPHPSELVVAANWVYQCD